ncbi:membrane protein [Mumia flava]|uniref:Membrane protein n=1 Tax=Mumia flava TaxID=1348852 RepID=A0A0B2BSX3_9ACTN|nr:YhjD/YihY/BrkB family envelope integrity protein [Mumia flava]PJJ53784.1 membrane protein [Mumia flava]
MTSRLRAAYERGRTTYEQGREFGMRVREGVEATFIGACMRRMYGIDGRNRAVTLAGQAFVGFIPLMIVVASFWPLRGDDEDVGDNIIDGLDLTGSTADAVEMLFGSPPSASGGITLIGYIILIMSLSSFSRSMQRLFEAIWELGPRGLRGTFESLGATLLLLACFVLVGYAGVLVGKLPLSRLLTLPVTVLVLTPVWVLLIRMMTSRRIEARHLLLSGVLFAVAQVLVGWATQIYFPHLIAVDAQRYGVIGVAFAFVSWLVVIAYLFVGCAVLGREATDWVTRRWPDLPWERTRTHVIR